MPDMTVPLLILSGPVGVGKSSVGDELSVKLMEQWVPHSFIDLDALAQTFPRPAGDPYGSRLALKNMADVWRNCRAAGARNLIVARVVETAAEREAIAAAVPGSRTTLCHLRASEATLLARVRQREMGAGLDWHLKRTLELARSLEETCPFDLAVEADNRSLKDIAEDLCDQMTWES
ncbi:MAG: hypothetical protein AAF530_01630 [Pseudomonadota bacterium]